MAALVLLVYCALCVHALPMGDIKAIHRHKDSPVVWKKSPNSGMKMLPHAQDTLKDNHKGWKNHPTSSKSDFSNRPRCGVPDYPSQKQGINYQNEVQSSKRYRPKRFVLFGARWDKTNLTYKILRPPWQVNLEKLREVFKDALRVWSDVTPLTFTEVTSGRADINIDFTRYQHGDNLPFDGPGGILAHAFFPKTYREGDIHFDYDEFWTLGNSMGTDLLQVAAHEFGHVLGLHHSLAPGAIMSPFYSFSYPLQLSEDDKKGIQYLYGTKPVQEREQEQQTTRQPETTETNEIERTTPNECYTDFSAVSMIRGELFFFKSGYVWRIRNGRLQPGYPAQASRHWGGIPDNIDAAFEDRSGNIWFFQGQNYWVFDAERQITGPDSVQKLGLSVTDIQAALTWGEDKAQKIYFFKGGKYWRFNPEENRVEWSHARSMADWRGIPKDIDAAFLDRYGYAHFLRGRQYWKFDPVEVKALEGYPRYIGMDFFGCPPSMYQ